MIEPQQPLNFKKQTKGSSDKSRSPGVFVSDVVSAPSQPTQPNASAGQVTDGHGKLQKTAQLFFIVTHSKHTCLL